jgi:hypothetical protein
MEETERLMVEVQNMLTNLHQHRIHSLSSIRHQVRMEEIERLVVVQNMLTNLHQYRIHSLSSIRHQVRMEEMERLMVEVQNMFIISTMHRIHSLSSIKQKTRFKSKFDNHLIDRKTESIPLKASGSNF